MVNKSTFSSVLNLISDYYFTILLCPCLSCGCAIFVCDCDFRHLDRGGQIVAHRNINTFQKHYFPSNPRTLFIVTVPAKKRFVVEEFLHILLNVLFHTAELALSPERA